MMLYTISIHASLAGGDFQVMFVSDPTRPISIHTSLAGGDAIALLTVAISRPNFNPRLPRGRRRCSTKYAFMGAAEFQSTPPSREATTLIYDV